jgi:gliding motility-associated-like protein
LTASFVPGASYFWTGPNGFSSTLQNPVLEKVTINDAGAYSVTVQVGQCTSFAATTDVTVNIIPASPVLSSNAPVCEGAVLNLSASSISGAQYSWSGPNNFVSGQQNPSLSNAGLSASGDYSVKVSVKGCSSIPVSTKVDINPLPIPPVITTNSPICAGNSLTLNAATISGAVYNWSGPAGFASSEQNPVIANAPVNTTGVYSVKATVNGCTGNASSATVSVNSIPAAPVLSSNSPVCEGNTIRLASGSVATASYNWYGPNGFTSTQQNPLLPAAATAATGQYTATITVNGCTSPASVLSITVNRLPEAPAVPSRINLCEGADFRLAASSIPGASYDWTGPFNFSTTAQNPVMGLALPQQSGIYSVRAILNGCPGPVATIPVTITANPLAPLISVTSPVCSGSDVLLKASDMPGATYQWTGPNGFSSILQNPIIPAAAALHSGTYSVSVMVNGCVSTSPASASVVVNQTPAPPLVLNSGPVCEGSNLQLTASALANTILQWRGPGGFSSQTPTAIIPNITAAQAGIYSASASLAGCTSLTAQTTIRVDKPAVAIAGKDLDVCSNTTIVHLKGTVSGGSGTGIWSTTGSGVFAPAADNLETAYYPAEAERKNASVQLQLRSTDNKTCAPSTSFLTIRFIAPPSATAGKDQEICADENKVSLNGTISGATGFIWSTSGSGYFSPSQLVLNPDYIPSSADKTSQKVSLKLSTKGSEPCSAAESVTTLVIRSPPAIANESTTYILENTSAHLYAVEKNEKTTYQWSPAQYLDKDTAASPLCTPKESIQYKLFVRDAFGCTSFGEVWVKVLRQPLIPNVFTPNSDGVNDRWVIKNLADYDDCTMDVFNRYGQVVYRSTGYNREWDGTSNGKPLPAGTYYYIIDQKKGLKPLSGFVDIVR